MIHLVSVDQVGSKDSDSFSFFVLGVAPGVSVDQVGSKDSDRVGGARVGVSRLVSVDQVGSKDSDYCSAPTPTGG